MEDLAVRVGDINNMLEVFGDLFLENTEDPYKIEQRGAFFYSIKHQVEELLEELENSAFE